MKILFDNVFLDATFSAGEASANYPVTNLIDRFLKVRYQHTASSFDTVTITMAAATDINCFFAGFSNSTGLVIRFYDSLDALLLTENLSVNLGVNAFHKATTYSVKKIEIDVYGTSGTYLGGVAGGVAEAFLDPVSPWNEEFDDNSLVNSSADAQSTNERIKPIRRYTWLFRDLLPAIKNSYQDLYLTYGQGARVWLDSFEKNHTFLAPQYVIIAGPPVTIKNGRRFDMEWSFREAR